MIGNFRLLWFLMWIRDWKPIIHAVQWVNCFALFHGLSGPYSQRSPAGLSRGILGSILCISITGKSQKRFTHSCRVSPWYVWSVTYGSFRDILNKQNYALIHNIFDGDFCSMSLKNWLVTTWLQYGWKSDEKQNSMSWLKTFLLQMLHAEKSPGKSISSNS